MKEVGKEGEGEEWGGGRGRGMGGGREGEEWGGGGEGEEWGVSRRQSEEVITEPK